MEKNNTLLVVAMLIIGLGMGYFAGSMRGIHEMSNGDSMNNGEMSMTSMMESMNAELAKKSGDEFDKAFLSEMIIHHEGAVGMAKAALTSAKRQEIKNLAQAIISAQNTEISEMKAWQKSWYGIE